MSKNPYSSRLDTIQYEPTGRPISLDRLCDKRKYKKMIAEIKKANLPEDVTEFLLLAATRHLVFNYQSIAEYYSSASTEVQELMEKSALVILDVDDAIKYGYVTFSETICDLLEEDEDADDEDL